MNFLLSRRLVLRIRYPIVLSIALMLTLVCELSAQPNADLVPLFGRSSITGTGRAASIADAIGSVGADLSCIDINPAGLGLYRSGDVSITLGARIAKDQSMYDNSLGYATQPSFQLPQAGFSWTKLFNQGNRDKDHMGFDSHPLRAITFAINFERSSFFSRSQNFGSSSNNNSLVSNYAQWASAAGGPNFWESAMMYYAGMINNNNNSSNYYSRVYGPVQQIGNIETRGGVDKISLGLGGNIDDKLYFGFSLSVPILSYTVSPQMTENELGDTAAVNFPTYNLQSQINETGVGFTGNLGLIYRPVPWARFGVAYGLPTWYFLNETYYSSLTYTEDSAGLQGSNTITTDDFLNPPQTINYRLRMPMKGTVSASFFLKESGFISVDYEFQNIGSTRYHFPDTTVMPSGSDTLYNNYLKSTYGWVHTVRVGIEGAIKILRLHAGYSFSSSAFKPGQAFVPGYNEVIQSATCGVGVRLKKGFYFDLAYAFTFTKDALQGVKDYVWGFQLPFDQVSDRLITHTISLTLGWKISQNGGSRKKARPQNNYNPPPPVDSDERY